MKQSNARHHCLSILSLMSLDLAIVPSLEQLCLVLSSYVGELLFSRFWTVQASAFFTMPPLETKAVMIACAPLFITPSVFLAYVA